MKRILIAFALILATANVMAQDAAPFKGYIYNKEYKVYLRFNLYDNNIKVPGQEIFGEIAGFLRSTDDSRCWMITGASIDEKHNKANLDIINDYGSEDLTATLSYNPADSTYTLKQGEGSTLKIARNRKWVKLPGTMVFVKENK